MHTASNILLYLKLLVEASRLVLLQGTEKQLWEMLWEEKEAVEDFLGFGLWEKMVLYYFHIANRNLIFVIDLKKMFSFLLHILLQFLVPITYVAIG